MMVTTSPAFAQEEVAGPELPADYQTRPAFVDKLCGHLNLKMYQGVTPTSDIQVATYTWNGEMIAAAISTLTETGEDFSAFGLYKGQWLQLDEEASNKAIQRLFSSAHFDAGQGEAIEARAECEKAVTPTLADISEAFKDLTEEIRNGLK